MPNKADDGLGEWHDYGVELVLAVLLVLFGLVMFAACGLGGLWGLLSALRLPSPERGRAVARGMVQLFAALLLATVPWVAARMAESSTGWVDIDHDGMLDGFANGSYDWVDINGGAWTTRAGVQVVAILGGLLLALAVLRRIRRGVIVHRVHASARD